jgi:hypothetical protein
MTPRPDPHRYLRTPGEASDWLGRVSCQSCRIPDHPAAPRNAVHQVEALEDDSARILGEGSTDVA